MICKTCNGGGVDPVSIFFGDPCPDCSGSGDLSPTELGRQLDGELERQMFAEPQPYVLGPGRLFVYENDGSLGLDCVGRLAYLRGDGRTVSVSPCGHGIAGTVKAVDQNSVIVAPCLTADESEVDEFKDFREQLRKVILGTSLADATKPKTLYVSVQDCQAMLDEKLAEF